MENIAETVTMQINGHFNVLICYVHTNSSSETFDIPNLPDKLQKS